MAHRNIKITRNIVQTCNKLCVFNRPDSRGPASNDTTVSATNSNYFHNTGSNGVENESSNFIHLSEATQKLNSKVKSFFSEPIIAASTQKGTIFDLQNLETTNNISNSPRFSVTTRSYVSKKKPGDKECEPAKKKCIKNLKCPRFVMEDCPRSDGSDCKREYQDPHCTKKMAPYPSYSELCAYRLEENPSECLQCPWQKCGGVDDIKPQKKKYHTTTRAINMARIPNKTTEMPTFLMDKQCDASKKPCKEPPPKCKKPEKEKCPEKKKKDNKKCKLDAPIREAWSVSGSVRNLDLQKYNISMAKIDRFKEEIGVPSNLAQRIVYEMKECPKDNSKCPKRNISPPDVDHSMNGLPFLYEAKKHDKGHPPPCEDPLKPSSQQCPEKIKKKIYRKERDLNEPAYRRNPKPYPKHDHEQ